MPDPRGEQTQPTITVRCVACGATKNVRAGEVPAADVPMCSKCFSPMVAVRAER